MSNADRDIDVLAITGGGESFASHFDLDFSPDSLEFVDALTLAFAQDPSGDIALKLSAIWDRNDCDWAVMALKQNGDNRQLLRFQERIDKVGRCYLMVVCARNLGGKWEIKSGWFGGKKVGLQFAGGKFLPPAHFFQPRLAARIYADLARSLGR